MRGDQMLFWRQDRIEASGPFLPLPPPERLSVTIPENREGIFVNPEKWILFSSPLLIIFN
jgi:hypothetical protein